MQYSILCHVPFFFFSGLENCTTKCLNTRKKRYMWYFVNQPSVPLLHWTLMYCVIHIE